MGWKDGAIGVGLERVLGKWNRDLTSLWLLLSMAPFVPGVFGYTFLPSTEWVAMIELPALVAGLVAAAASIWIFVKGFDAFSGGKLKLVITFLSIPILGYFTAQSIVVAVVPMSLALVADRQVELTYTVTSAGRISHRCRAGIKFNGLPLVFDRLCGVSEAVLQRVAPGDRIVVFGHGTGFGVFAEGLDRAD